MLCMHQSLPVLLSEIARNFSKLRGEFYRIDSIRFNHSIYNMINGLIRLFAEFDKMGRG